MLFRPYKAIYIGKRPLPFTPGLIPRNQDRLAVRVSDTIMGSLLTPEELQKLAKRLLDTERVQGAILWLLQLALKQIKGDRQAKTAEILAAILHDLFGESLAKLLKVLARRQDFLEKQINQIFDRLVLEFSLSEQQARQFSDWLLETVLPADVLEHERKVAEETAKNEGKPEAAIAKITEGRVTGFIKEVALLEQAFAKDQKKSVAAILTEAQNSVSAFYRFRVGQ